MEYNIKINNSGFLAKRDMFYSKYKSYPMETLRTMLRLYKKHNKPYYKILAIEDALSYRLLDEECIFLLDD